ncbi:MAG: hypothetical protein CSA26_06895 [Desulfobacterales bacterium]|nr:MAG: hypothetical protein CSA26_06895 [Desulfobacterales bacterium]
MKAFATLFLCILFVATPCSHATEGRLLIVDSAQGPPYEELRESMLTELEQLGFVSGRNLSVSHWSLGNENGLAKRVWREEKDNEYDVIFLNGTVAAINFYRFAYNRPPYRFIFGAVTDPVGVGLIDGFELPPPGNFTGICYPVKLEERLRFVTETMPDARNIGYIYADMPQSQSYKKWLTAALASPEFSHLTFHFRKVPFVKGEGGSRRMATLAKPFIKELDPVVDLFLSPNDQMGVQQSFARIVAETATKPLVGLGLKDVMSGQGATMAIYPSMEASGKLAARMIYELLKGTDIKKIPPQYPPYGVAFDLKKAESFHLTIPEYLILQAGGNILR